MRRISPFAQADIAAGATRGLFAVLATLAAHASPAATISFSGTSSDGHPVSATADFTLDDVADTLTLQLINTTATTIDSGELLTGVDLQIGAGLAASLTSAVGVQRTVSGDGTFVDGPMPVALSWSRTMVGLSVLLDFTPNAKDALLGLPTAGSYASSNGSVRGNAGHNPFVAETATFMFSVPGLGPMDSLAINAWRFGTGLNIATPEVPEPVATALALTALGLTWARRGKRV